MTAMLAAKLLGFQTVLLGGAAIYAVVFALAAIAWRYRSRLPYAATGNDESDPQQV